MIHMVIQRYTPAGVTEGEIVAVNLICLLRSPLAQALEGFGKRFKAVNRHSGKQAQDLWGVLPVVGPNVDDRLNPAVPQTKKMMGWAFRQIAAIRIQVNLPASSVLTLRLSWRTSSVTCPFPLESVQPPRESGSE